MVYMGSKSKYTKYIVPILQQYIDDNNIKIYIEPFVGGANVIDKINCVTKIGNDKNYCLIELHKKAQTNFDTIPEHGNSEWWYKAKDIYRKYQGTDEVEKEMPGWEIGAISFLASFSNGGFSRGYAKNTERRDYYNEAYRNLLEQSKNENYKNIIFQSGDYSNIKISGPALIYCDPPYQNTKPYGYKFETVFDYDKYWNWVRENSKNNIIICSEQFAPDDFEVIWKQEVKRTAGKDNNFKAIEKLFKYKG